MYSIETDITRPHLHVQNKVCLLALSFNSGATNDRQEREADTSRTICTKENEPDMCGRGLKHDLDNARRSQPGDIMVWQF